MTRRLATQIGSAALMCSLITTTVVVVELVAASADQDPATDADAGWGCAAAAAEYRRYFGDVNSVPETLIEGKSTSLPDGMAIVFVRLSRVCVLFIVFLFRFSLPTF